MSKNSNKKGRLEGEKALDETSNGGEDNVLLTMGHRKYKASVSYARALFQFSLRFGLLETIYQNFNDFISVWHRAPLLRLFLCCHAIDRYTRRGRIKAFFEQHTHRAFLSFIEKLIDNNHTDILPGIHSAFSHMVAEAQHKRKLRVISSAPMSDKQKEMLKESMEDFLKLEITIKNEIDPGILAGFVCYTDSIKIDMSLKKDLDTLKSRILSIPCGGIKNNEG
jgi:ATP synthase F1 delta subunit